MDRLTAVAIFSVLALVSCQQKLPCNSPLRKTLPQYFSHCVCRYSDWSDWEVVPNSAVDVPSSQCKSGNAVMEKRTRTVLGGEGCSDTAETREICSPDKAERLIIGLGLGSSGQHISTSGGGGSNVVSTGGGTGGGGGNVVAVGTNTANGYSNTLNTGTNNIISGGYSYRPVNYVYPSRMCSSREVCSQLTSKRLIRREREAPKLSRRSAPDPQPLANDPLPFRYKEHGSRFRRQASCNSDSTQHILFVLDTSGSIGRANFERMTSALGKLVPLFCKQVKIAAMTFNQDYYVEFCFNCFDNSCNGRDEARDAMKAIKYRSGSTHTGGAAKCVCDVLLSSRCGISSSADCIDVVFITDGWSNGPRDVCTEVECLHDRGGVNTFAIGIGNYNQQELDCISAQSNPQYSLFDFDDFDDFVSTLDHVIQILSIPDPITHEEYTCVNPQTIVGTNKCT